jgi:hypothetical protein
MGRIGMTRAAMTLAVVGVLLVPVTVSTSYAAGPTWDEVEAARGDEAATAATIAEVSAALDELLIEAARLGDEAVRRSAEAQAADAALAAAERLAIDLDRRSTAAAATAAESAERAAQIAMALYRSGGSDLTTTLLLSTSADSSSLLDRLGTLDRVGSQVTQALAAAQVDANLAETLADQARAARDERDARAAALREAAEIASAAEAAADAAVAAQQAQLTQLYSQLAALKNTTAELEQQVRIGQQPGNAPGSSGSGGSTPPSGGTTTPPSSGGGFTVPGNEVNNVAAARQYAFDRLAGVGYGQDQMNCLLWLWNRESGWRTNAYNRSSGAYGIPQSLPGSKMATAGADWRTNYQTQVNWGLAYITARYGTPCGAWAHSQTKGWY